MGIVKNIMTSIFPPQKTKKALQHKHIYPSRNGPLQNIIKWLKGFDEFKKNQHTLPPIIMEVENSPFGE